VNDILNRIERKLDYLISISTSLFRLELKMNSDLQTAIDNIKATVTAVTSVDDSAKALVDSIPQLIADAVSKVVANGVDPSQLQAITDLQAALTQHSGALAASVTANTPAATP
jgi:hypothetical protein